MKYILHISIILCWINLDFIYAQTEKDQLFESITKLKKEHSHKGFRIDSSLIEVSAFLKKENLSTQKISKDSLRNLLIAKGNYDYNVEYIELSYPKSKKIENLIEEPKNDKLKQIVNDSLYNTVEIALEKGSFNNKLTVLATQNYIQFDKAFQGEIILCVENTIEYKIIPGISKVKNMYYSTYIWDNNIKKTVLSKVPVIIEGNNRFKVKFEITNIKGKPMEIEFFDSNGKTLSYIKNR